MMSESTLINAAVGLTAALLFYAAVARGLQKVGDAFRERALEIYSKLVRSRDADEDFVRRLDAHLDEVFSVVEAWRWAGMMFCVVFFIVPYRKLKGIEPNEPRDGLPAGIRKDLSRFNTMTMLATITNSPVAALLFVLFGVIGFSFSIPIKMLGKMLVSHEDAHRHWPA